MNIYKEKKEYNSPELCRIELDHEISLAMASDANPEGEPDWLSKDSGMQQDPFKNQLG